MTLAEREATHTRVGRNENDTDRRHPQKEAKGGGGKWEGEGDLGLPCDLRNGSYEVARRGHAQVRQRQRVGRGASAHIEYLGPKPERHFGVVGAGDTNRGYG